MKIRDVVMGANASIYHRLNLKMIKGVAYPRTEDQVVDAVKLAREQGIDVTPKGGGSGLSGACTGGNRERIMISSLQMKEVLSISKDQRYADVQAGATPDEINAVLQPIGMKFWVAPSSRDIATVGGLLSTDGGGNDAWVNGTMRDNTLRARMVLYDGRRISVDQKGVWSNDPELEADLKKAKMTLNDVAGSHGTLGFITEVRVAIRPVTAESLIGGVIHYPDSNEMGQSIGLMIEKRLPIRYGEAIAFAHEDVRQDLTPPMLIIELPESEEPGLKRIADFERMDAKSVSNFKDVRLKLPKRNPKSGLQMAIFEDYGFYGGSLASMQDRLDEIDTLLRRHGFTPFAKYGHAPSKWYMGDNSPTYGVILHSREIRPQGKTGKDIFRTVQDLVELCDRLKITPKPEHKWPYSDSVKNARLVKLRKVIGSGFNQFMFEPQCNDVLSTMV